MVASRWTQTRIQNVLVAFWDYHNVKIALNHVENMYLRNEVTHIVRTMAEMKVQYSTYTLNFLKHDRDSSSGIKDPVCNYILHTGPLSKSESPLRYFKESCINLTVVPKAT